ncbi:MAG: hypothetical protein P1P67_11225 [Treponema phagedenis]|uniref:hypothetical protein n=1 Tax=Treponema phagedenis TaxID=162 RepID=UPI0004B83B89|nr:hypothetical protein [Treponema phagedenis]QKS91296.1 hypothetical protein HPJ96_00980 [Treponema phagedenis]
MNKCTLLWILIRILKNFIKKELDTAQGWAIYHRDAESDLEAMQICLYCANGF